MELADGESITRYCEARSLGLNDWIDLFLRVVDAVQHAHTKGVIHRDLKPSNILIAERDGRSEPKIIDFGGAKAFERSVSQETQHIQREQVPGTPAYVSPRQIEIGSDAGIRSDVDALGVLLYELFVGRPPFDAKALASTGFDEMKRLIRERDRRRPAALPQERGR